MIDNQTASQSNMPSQNDRDTTAASDTNNKETTKDDNQKLDPKPDATTNQNDGDDDNQKNESSTLSTAFTISFDEDSASNSKKLFGIRDSIRKFAPPKPHTIEKPRQPKNDGQENSYMSIESAPAGGCQAGVTLRRDNNNSCRSSGRRSDSSRQSNISESAAFLIDKMLNCKQGESLSSICLNSSEKAQKDNKSRSKLAHSSGDILDDEVDFCEERSDNGTYIVGTDPESEAARRKIDELFGVVKAPQMNNINDSREQKKAPAAIARASRQPKNKPSINCDRQEHFSRLATGRHSSRSSSLSRQELASNSHRPRSASRQSRNSSCDRATKLPVSRHERVTTHSNRPSSHRNVSDGDTRSSRSSLHNDMEITNSDTPSMNNPSMKFNRAFALRRARLGLAEPVPSARISSTPNAAAGGNGNEFVESPTTSPRRNIGAKYGHTSNSAPQNLSRSDGGRFSLRMKNKLVPNRLAAGYYESGFVSQQQQQGVANESHLSRVSSSSKMSRPSQSSLGSHLNPVHSTSSATNQSGDELELMSPSRLRGLNTKSNGSLRKDQQADPETDGWDYCNDRLNYSFGLETISYKRQIESNRTCNSAGKRGSSGQLGALDCLVISAISTLSVKIRSSVCDLMVEHAKRLPSENETRLIVEEILPQLTANSTRPKSPTSIEEIDQSLYFDLAQALKNLKKVEQMVDVMKLISNQMDDPPISNDSKSPTSNRVKASKKTLATAEGSDSNPNSETNSSSPV
jgi:hypothetical protein